jgi:hypothetical protein
MPFFCCVVTKEPHIVVSISGKLIISVDYFSKLTGISFASAVHLR